MKINNSVFEEVRKAQAQILVVTKYYEKTDTDRLIKNCEQKYSSIIFGYGENRVIAIREKEIDRSKLHYIGALQSKKLKDISKYCSVIHSLDSLKHAERLNDILERRGSSMKVFLQIKLDPNKPTGIEVDDLVRFIEVMKSFENLEILGISGMGRSMHNEKLAINNKRKEFQLLLDLRDKYLPGKLISAGTSQDYEIALDMGIDIVRVGRSAVV